MDRDRLVRRLLAALRRAEADGRNNGHCFVVPAAVWQGVLAAAQELGVGG
jgi:hypothetical protein